LEIKNLTLQSTPHNFPFRLYLINTIFPLQIIPIFLVITTLFSFNPSSHTSPFISVLLRCSIPPSTPLSHQHFHALSSQICHTSPFIGVLLRCSVPPSIPTFPRSIPLLCNRLSIVASPFAVFPSKQLPYHGSINLYITLIPLFLSKLFSVLQFLLRSYILSIHQKVLFLLRLPIKS
jgi:hypothetical protein